MFVTDFEVDLDGRERAEWRNDTALYDYYHSLVDSIPDKIPGVYCLYNKENELLYVGMTVNLQRRIVDHLAKGPASHTKHFADEIASVRCCRVDNPEELDLMETRTIRELVPKYNVEKTPKSPRYQSFLRKEAR
ncbi:nucleotide excision repair endonuclease [Brevibacillus porteri]|uniref:nucleotide excision repair endonuclease n=1 Tax=Brevibacillus porteri TaxID=2126350 RepID=UPI003D25F7B6